MCFCYFLPTFFPFKVCPFCNKCNRFSPVLVATYFLLMWQCSAGVALNLLLVFQKSLYFVFFVACRQRVFWLVCLYTMPFWRAFAPHILFNVWYMFSSTKWLCTVTALCIMTVLIYKFNGGTAALHSNAMLGVFISPCNFMQALVL